MFNAHTVHVYSPKAGVGCSTVAVALALIAGETGAVVHAADLSPAGDLAAVVGIPIPDTGRIAAASATLELVRLDPDTVAGGGWVAHIVDWGTRPVPADVPGHRVVVMANCYLAAAAYTRRPSRIDHGGRVHLVSIIDPNGPSPPATSNTRPAPSPWPPGPATPTSPGRPTPDCSPTSTPTTTRVFDPPPPSCRPRSTHDGHDLSSQPGGFPERPIGESHPSPRRATGNQLQHREQSTPQPHSTR